MPAKAPPARFHWWGFLLLCAIFLAVAFLWETVWVYPLRLFVVLLHELSHAIAAWVTGGRVDAIELLREEGGHCVTRGGNAFVIASAGYLGSMLFGAGILLVATRTGLSRWFATLLGFGVAVVAVRFMPNGGFGRVFAGGSGLALAFLALLPRVVTEVALRIVGVTSCLYAILDIKSDVLDHHHDGSDAAALAQQTHVPAGLWGALWIAISLVVTFLAAKGAVTGARRQEVQSPRR